MSSNQLWYLPDQADWGMVCSNCHAVAWYKFSSGQAEAAKSLGGRLSTGKLFYCPACAVQKTNLVLHREQVEHYVRTCWAKPNELWK